MQVRGTRLQEELSPLMEAITDLIETFVSNIRRGKLGPRDGKSLSMTAASETVQLMHDVISLFRGFKVRPCNASSTEEGVHVMSCRQVHRLLSLTSFAGDALLRAQFGTLMLTNVTRRVLSFIRRAADENKVISAFSESPKARQADCLGSRRREASGTCAPTYEENKIEVGEDEDDDVHIQDILTVGIPGGQTLRRAPSRRELEDVERDTDGQVRVDDFFNCVFQHIEQFRAEIEGMNDALCDRAAKQLNPTDTVITIGCSHTTQRYLLHALSSGTSFKVIILEGAPLLSKSSHMLAEELRASHADVQVLPDSSTFAVMGTCTKVLIGAESVLANGGLLAHIGTHPLCIAAKHFAVPVLVATTTLKMSPFYPSDAYCTSLVKISRSSAQEIPWNTYGSPGDVLPEPHGAEVETLGAVVVHSPVTEYVPPELITLYATNESEYTPSQIHRIVRENYNPED
ncbi:putative Initiation factor 2 subunit family [Trypanosoma vivax]|uniref:Translation initiation factor eIF2B subunit beta n=1 Tax=Trypanosoma vivax (strain Y486) TaxID=1055687 RepID=G0U118_TRYVY|nr:putative eIF-2B GDP-GTP exchange factor [Trypanosoma vivax]KAH8607876.1 putative Initiation factor 2 subunit family [Trypanosoma vivax]CCC49773.1 putative eIF-2B GDP-GTP exchange factor [Trypanosoma vivax Y486]